MYVTLRGDIPLEIQNGNFRKSLLPELSSPSQFVGCSEGKSSLDELHRPLD
jgi:hypothetical protein